MHTLRHVVFSGGVTGGHLFPGIAVAEVLRSSHPGVQITFAGRGMEWERDHVATAGYDYLPLPCHAWPRRPWRWPRFVFNQMAGRQQARHWLRGQAIDCVVGLGGYASAPLAQGAVDCGIPLVLLEQNARPGRATRWLAPQARYVCSAFAEARAWLKINDSQFQHTGNPMRAAFARLTPTMFDPTQSRRLLVLGGSRGSGELNRVVPTTLAQLPQATNWQIVHQTGVDDQTLVAKRYAAAGQNTRVAVFLDDMPTELAAADLVVCRAGGATLAELAVAGVAALVCPWGGASDDHQRHNARVLAATGACRLVELDKTAEPATLLAQNLTELMLDTRQRRAMTTALREHARPQAAQDVAHCIERAANVVSHQQQRVASDAA